jgi:glutamyl/glutaminyl-tRNA synthetase
MVRRFDLSAVNPAPAAFDEEKLEWMNGVYLRALGRDELVDLALPFLQKGGLVSAEPTPGEREYAAKVLALEQERMKLLSDAPQLAAFLFGDRAQYDEDAVNKWLKRDYVPGALRAVAERLKAAGKFDRAEIENLVRALAQEQGRKAAELIHPIRVAVTGRTEGPGLFETLELLGRDRVLLRLEEALSLASPPSA